MTADKLPHILYVEDDRGLALLLKKRLERRGFVVTLAANGAEGLLMFDPDVHDVVAVDQNMPGLDGLEVITALATYDPIPPIIMITGNGDERVAVEAMKLGARDYIVKDAEGGYLELVPAVITQVLDQQQLVEQKRQAEETLRQSEQRYRSLVELSPDGIVVYRDDRFVFVNDAALRLMAAEDGRRLIGSAVIDVFHPDSCDVVWQRLQRTQAYSEQITLLEGKLLRFDGQSVDVEIMAAPIMFESQAATQMLIREVTERKRAEEARRESERLRAALDKEKELGDLKTRLMITISHEFRTPLTVAYTSAELLEKFYDRMPLAQREKHLHKIEGEIGKMTEMIEDITSLIHTTFERLALNLEPTDLKSLSESVLTELQTSSETPRQIVLNTETQLPTLVLDVRRIKYMLTNLLSNAIKYSAPGSPITVDLFKRDEGVVLQVSDHGIGIPPDELERVFEPFYRAGNVGNVRGTGLGLSVVKEIVEMQGGTITLRSEVNRGTEVTVYLPANPPPA